MKAVLERKTKETTIHVTIDIDGAGSYDVKTPNRFLDHMVETWARYAGFDVKLRAEGDLDHHIIEDTAITLGQAFRKAFDQRPCVRIAYDFVPMDDALVLCAVDLVDRPHYAGELPVPIWDHFFRSFAMEARINLHFEQLRGRDTHHTIEAATKAFARSLRRALEPRTTLVSTKGAVQTKGANAGTNGTSPVGKPGEADATRTQGKSRVTPAPAKPPSRKSAMAAAPSRKAATGSTVSRKSTKPVLAKPAPAAARAGSISRGAR